MLQAFLQYQATDAFRKVVQENVERASAEFIVDKNGLVVRKSPIDKAIQTIVSQAL